MKFTLYHQDLPDAEVLVGSIAIDTETMGLNLSRDKLCLIQICDANGKVVMVKFDINKSYNAPNLQKLISDASRQKIFHFARFDVLAISKYLSIDCIPNIYCTKIASKLARTYTDSHGLKTIVRELLSIEIDKEAQTSNWGAAELTPKQLQYAANDVLHLHALQIKLDNLLKICGRTEIAHRAFDAIGLITKLDDLGFGEGLFNH